MWRNLLNSLQEANKSTELGYKKTIVSGPGLIKAPETSIAFKTPKDMQESLNRLKNFVSKSLKNKEQ